MEDVVERMKAAGQADAKEAKTPRPLLTVADVARLCRVSVRAVWRWKQQGYLAFVQLPGGDLRFRPETVEALLQEKVVEQGQRPRHRAGRAVAARSEARAERTRRLLEEAGQKS